MTQHVSISIFKCLKIKLNWFISNFNSTIKIIQFKIIILMGNYFKYFTHLWMNGDIHPPIGEPIGPDQDSGVVVEL